MAELHGLSMGVATYLRSGQVASGSQFPGFPSASYSGSSERNSRSQKIMISSLTGR